MKFIHDTLAQRVLFGTGTVETHVFGEVERMGVRKVMLIASTRENALVARLTAGLPSVVRVEDVRQHVPADLADSTRVLARESGVEVLVAVGGGSATGLAKAVALTESLPIIAVPTTYSGSEATNVWGLTENGIKTTGVSPNVLPKSVVYDVDLSRSLPVPLSVASGLNALAHAVDALWAPNADPINQALALEAARAIGESLPAIVSDPDGESARATVLYGSYLSAVAFASAGSALHHKICHILGGTFGLAHAPTHAVVLPYVLSFNAPAVPELAERLALALSGGADRDATHALEHLRSTLRPPRSLSELGLPESALAELVTRTMAAAPKSNPTPVTERNLTRLLTAAWAGEPPTTQAPSN